MAVTQNLKQTVASEPYKIVRHTDLSIFEQMCAELLAVDYHAVGPAQTYIDPTNQNQLTWYQTMVRPVQEAQS